MDGRGDDFLGSFPRNQHHRQLHESGQQAAQRLQYHLGAGSSQIPFTNAAAGLPSARLALALEHDISDIPSYARELARLSSAEQLAGARNSSNHDSLFHSLALGNYHDFQGSSVLTTEDRLRLAAMQQQQQQQYFQRRNFEDYLNLRAQMEDNLDSNSNLYQRPQSPLLSPTNNSLSSVLNMSDHATQGLRSSKPHSPTKRKRSDSSGSKTKGNKRNMEIDVGLSVSPSLGDGSSETLPKNGVDTNRNTDSNDKDKDEIIIIDGSPLTLPQISDVKDASDLKTNTPKNISFNFLLTASNEVLKDDEPQELDNDVSMIAALVADAEPILTATTTTTATDQNGHSTKSSLKPGYTDDQALNLLQELKTIQDKDEIVPGYFAYIPKLPEEPDYVPNKEGDENNGKKDSGDQNSRGKEKKSRIDGDLLDVDDEPQLFCVTEPVVLTRSDTDAIFPVVSSGADSWFPSQSEIRSEKKALGTLPSTSDESDSVRQIQLSETESDILQINKSTHERLFEWIEPGTLEKLPYCQLSEKSGSLESYFCCQTTELFPEKVMVCCSVCATWRHAECGGHHTSFSTKNDKGDLVPVCDRCYREQKVLEQYPGTDKRLKKQRIWHLRSALATTAVMRESSYERHDKNSKQYCYKWPLGAVSSNQILSHIKKTNARYDRSHKKWADMTKTLGDKPEWKGKEKVRHRTKELKRLATCLEDAESHTDRRNMALFLKNDTLNEFPAGFEKVHINFFDPEEYDMTESEESDSEEDTDTSSSISSDVQGGESNENGDAQDVALEGKRDIVMAEDENNGATDQNLDEIIATTKGAKSEHQKSKKYTRTTCIRSGCSRLSRFDSMFCSDACGVSTFEVDILQSLQNTFELIPFQLRS